MCDCLVAVGAEAATRATLFAKNSDRRDGECQRFLQTPAAAHPPGAVVRCTHLTIPQVAETYRVMGHSPWWVFGFEHGVNEHGVAIGNEAVFSREPVEDEPGLIGMDLVRLGLERGRSAREALEVIATLIESHGQGGAAFAPGAAGHHNGFLLADPEEAWILQTSGRRWAARRARLDAISSHLSLSADWEIGSRDLDAFARSAGWWLGAGRLDVSAAYRHHGVPGRVSEGRLRRSLELLRAERGRLDAAAMRRILRDHLDGGAAPPADASFDDERHFTLCMHAEPVGTTTASLVAELPRDRERPWPVWISFATACTGVFVPVYLDGVIPPAYARGGETPTAGSAWWTMKRLQDAALRDLPRFGPWLRDAWAPVEAWVEEERSAAERRAAVARASDDADGAARILSELMERVAARVLMEADGFALRLEGGDASAAAR